MKLFSRISSTLIVAAACLIMVPTSSFALTACSGQKFTYKNARVAARQAEKAVIRAERNQTRDLRYYDRQIEKNNNKLARVGYRLEYLKSQQVGGFVGTLLGGGWGLNNNISLNSKIDALKKQRDYLTAVVGSYTTARQTTLDRDTAALDAARAVATTANASFTTATDALVACLNAVPTA